MKSWIGNAILVLISLTIALVFAEIALRSMLFSDNNNFKKLKDPSAYARYPLDKDEDFYNNNYWKLKHIFSGKKGLDNPHSLLGWGHPFNHKNYLHHATENLNGRRPVLLYGDSFAQCVDSTRCFEEILNADPEFSESHYLLNYGVGGYGVDQISLLLENSWKNYSNPFVIFSLLTTDMDRSMLSFRDAQKPYYAVEHGELTLKGVPIASPTKEYLDSNRPKIRSYLLSRLLKSKLNPFRNKTGKKEEKYIENLKVTNRLILEKVITELDDAGVDYLILLFSPESHHPPDWRLSFLTELIETNQVPYIRDKDIRLSDDTFSDYQSDRYSIRGDCHPTSYFNNLISMALKDIVLGNVESNSFAESQKDRFDRAVEQYRNQIQQDPEWLKQVEKKAKYRGIPRDSMLTLDAINMAQKNEPN